MLEVKVGLADAPYTADHQASANPTSTPQTFMHTFTAQNGGRTGIAFYPKGSSANGNRFCVDNVSLVRQ
jgi:hypothetical protein